MSADDLVVVVLLGLAVGTILGGLGGGGAIIVVPGLVYLVGVPIHEAITLSLVIVGLAAATGLLPYAAAGQVRYRVALVFGAVGLPGTWLGGTVNRHADGDVLLLAFAVVMASAAIALLFDLRRGRSAGRSSFTAAPAPRWPAAVPLAFAVGFLTGLFGVGGGFIVVPALLLVLRLPIVEAAGTSLLIVVLNSATALLPRVGAVHVDWVVLVPLAAVAMTAAILGKKGADRCSPLLLSRAFATLLVVVAACTAWQSMVGLQHPQI